MPEFKPGFGGPAASLEGGEKTLQGGEGLDRSVTPDKDVKEFDLEFAELKARMKVFVDKFSPDDLMRVLVSLRQERGQTGDHWFAASSSVLTAYASAPKSETSSFKDPIVAFASVCSLAELFMVIEALKEVMQQEENEQFAQYTDMHPEIPAPRRECGPEVAKLEDMIAAFEATYSLEALLSITELSVEDAPKHPIREPAKNALDPIVATLNALKDETNISTAEYERLRAQYKRLSQAVGMINRGRVDHTR